MIYVVEKIYIYSFELLLEMILKASRNKCTYLGVAIDVHHLHALESLPLQPEAEVRGRRNLTAGHAVVSETLQR